MQSTEFASQVMKDHMDGAASGSCPHTAVWDETPIIQM